MWPGPQQSRREQPLNPDLMFNTFTPVVQVSIVSRKLSNCCRPRAQTESCVRAPSGHSSHAELPGRGWGLFWGAGGQSCSTEKALICAIAWRSSSNLHTRPPPSPPHTPWPNITQLILPVEAAACIKPAVEQAPGGVRRRASRH